MTGVRGSLSYDVIQEHLAGLETKDLVGAGEGGVCVESATQPCEKPKPTRLFTAASHYTMMTLFPCLGFPPLY